MESSDVRSRGPTYLSLTIKIAYAIDGVVHRCDSGGPTGPFAVLKPRADQILAKYPKGATVTGYVDPNDPDRAVVFRDLSPSDQSYGLIAASWIAGVCIIWSIGRSSACEAWEYFERKAVNRVGSRAAAICQFGNDFRLSDPFFPGLIVIAMPIVGAVVLMQLERVVWPLLIPIIWGAVPLVLWALRKAARAMELPPGKYMTIDRDAGILEPPAEISGEGMGPIALKSITGVRVEKTAAGAGGIDGGYGSTRWYVMLDLPERSVRVGIWDGRGFFALCHARWLEHELGVPPVETEPPKQAASQGIAESDMQANQTGGAGGAGGTNSWTG